MGFTSFLISKDFDPRQVQDECYVEHQKDFPVRVYREFLKPLFASAPTRRVLDVGCGLGTEVKEAQKDGYEAYGVDLPNMIPFWEKAGNDPIRFFACNATRLPLCDHYFDFTWSFGVIEHIGTTSDTGALLPDYLQARCDYADELVRVTKPGGRIIVSCPNKSFPVDTQHGPNSESHFKELRALIAQKTKLHFHRTWGKNHLLSYSEIKRLFCRNESVESVVPLSLKGYFGFGVFQAGYLRTIKKLVRYYIEHMPILLRPTFLNPYMLVMILKRP